jgi:hypothetical protein
MGKIRSTFSAPCPCPALRSFPSPPHSPRGCSTDRTQRSGCKNAGGKRTDFRTKRAASLTFSCWDDATGRYGDTQRGDDPGPSTNVGYIHRREKRHDSTAAATTDTGIRPATRSGCGTLLVALLVLGIITAIVIFLGAFGLLDWIFS